MKYCYADTETYCEVPINYGAHRYAEEAEILIMTYAFDDGLVHTWDVTADGFMPKDLYNAFHDPEIKFIFHNCLFDCVILRAVYGIDLPMSRVHDTMMQARTVGLPGSLDTLCGIFRISFDKAKDKKGHELIKLFCCPRPKNSKLRRATRETHPKEWQQFLDYAASDITSMRELHLSLPKWNIGPGETAIWHLNVKTDRKGLCVDTELAESAIRAIGRAKTSINAATSAATNGQVERATQRDRLIEHILREYGIILPDLQASTLERRLYDPEVPSIVKELIAQRLQISTISTSKYQTLLNCVNKDGRLRGTLEYCGAGRTGRDAARKFQSQNLPSKNLLPQVDIDRAVVLFKHDAAELLYDDIMKLASSCVRGCIIAPPGHKLNVSDLKNIEGRSAAWLAGEEWKLQAYRDFDKGIGPDLYKTNYAKSFGIHHENVDKHQRDIGKVMELFLQFMGGVGAFLTGAATYDIDLDAMADAAYPSIPAHILKEARDMWLWACKRRQTFDLKEKTFIVCDSLKRMWREAHPEIVAMWGELKIAIGTAFAKPSSYHIVRKVKVRKVGSWLLIILPSGRALCYASPKYEYTQFSYMGTDSKTRKWQRIKSYEGKVFENIVQATARDIFMYSLPEIDKRGYEIVLRVHDEVVCETPDIKDFSADELSDLLATNPPWAPDMPLAASGFEAYRYRKG